MGNLTAYKYSNNSYIVASITAYDTTGTLVTSFSGYTAGFNAKTALTDSDAAALITETVTISNTTTGACYFTIGVTDLAAITNNSVLYYELWIRPASGDKITCETGTLTIEPTARQT